MPGDGYLTGIPHGMYGVNPVLEALDGDLVG
jgi:hypothetical protein